MRHEHYDDLFRLIWLMLDLEKIEKHETWLKLDIGEIFGGRYRGNVSHSFIETQSQRTKNYEFFN